MPFCCGWVHQQGANAYKRHHAIVPRSVYLRVNLTRVARLVAHRPHARGISDQTKAGGEQLQKTRSSFDHQNASRSTVISSRGHKTQSTACSLKGFTARPQLQAAAVQPWTHDAEASVEALPQHEVEVRHRCHHSLPGRNRQLQRLHCQQFRLHRPRLRLGLRWLRQPRRGTPDTPLTREVLRRRRPLLAW